MRLDNFSSVQELCALASKDQITVNALAELAGQVWEGKLVHAINAPSGSPAFDFISQQLTGEITFSENLHFEFFFSIFFIGGQLHKKPGTNLTELSEIIFHKTFREKKKSQPKRLSYDFPALCLINLHNFFGRSMLNEVKVDFDLSFHRISGNFDRAFPYFDATASEFYSFINFIFSRDEETFLNGFALAVNEFCAQHPVTGSELLGEVESDNNIKVKRIIPAILLGLTKSKGASYTLPFIIKMLKTGDETEVKNGLFILSNFDFINEAVWNEFGEEIYQEISLIENGENETSKEFLPGIYVRWINFIPAARELLISYSDSPSRQYQAIMSGILWLKADDYRTESWYETAIIKAAGWGHAEGTVASNMQSCLFKLVADHPSLAIKFLNAWIENEGNTIDELKNFTNGIARLFEQNHEICARWLTKMLRSENERFHLAIRQFMGELWLSGFKNFSLDKQMVSVFSFWEAKYVLFKILGYVDHKDALQSLAYSLLEREPFDENIAQLVTNAFTQHICYNYGGTYSFLKEKMGEASSEVKFIIKAILDNAEAYFEHSRRIKQVNELKWLKKTGKSFTHMKMKKISDDFKEELKKGEKNSIRSLFTKISLKGGKKFFSKYEGGYTVPTPLQNVGSSFELPMGELIDPVREVVNRIEWRTYKMKS